MSLQDRRALPAMESQARSPEPATRLRQRLQQAGLCAAMLTASALHAAPAGDGADLPPPIRGVAPVAAAPAVPAAPETAPAEAATAPEAGGDCLALTDLAMEAELSAAGAQAQDPLQEVELLDATARAWQAAATRCEGRARARALRNLEESRKAVAAAQERLGAGQPCNAAQENAQALQALAQQAAKEQRWSDAARLFHKTEGMWEEAVDRCRGEQQQLALTQRTQASAASHNAQFCMPRLERARAQTEQLNNAPARQAPAQRQQLYLNAESLWRLAASQCRGAEQAQALAQAEAIVQERGPLLVEMPAAAATPATLPAPPAEPTAAAAPPVADAASVPAVAPATVPTQSPARAAPMASPPLATPTPSVTPTATPPAPGASAASLAPSAAIPGAPARTAAGAVPGSPKASAGGTEAAAVEDAVVTPVTVDLGGMLLAGRFTHDPGSGKPGTWSGQGRVTWSNGDVYEGSLARNQRQGQGRFSSAKGLRYEGEWAQDRPHGRGTLKFPDGNVYEGQVANGMPEGTGRMVYASGDSYSGQFERGVPAGRGQYVWRNGQRYEGGFQGQRPHGTGTMRFANGDHYEGPLVAGQPHGVGRMRYARGDVYTGPFVAGLPEGQGRYQWKNGDHYVGAFKAGRKQGRGTLTWSNGDRWEGEFDNDEQYDAGTFTAAGTPSAGAVAATATVGAGTGHPAAAADMAPGVMGRPTPAVGLIDPAAGAPAKP